MTIRMLCAVILVLVAQTSFAIGAKQAHELIKQQKPELLGSGEELVSLYYFGQSFVDGVEQSVVGLERIGDDYLPIRWLLVFENTQLLGWFFPSNVFPAKLKEGFLIFPKGTSDGPIDLMPKPPEQLELKGKRVPFYNLDSPVILNPYTEY